MYLSLSLLLPHTQVGIMCVQWKLSLSLSLSCCLLSRCLIFCQLPAKMPHLSAGGVTCLRACVLQCMFMCICIDSAVKTFCQLPAKLPHLLAGTMKTGLVFVSLSVTQSAFASTSDRPLCFPRACVGLIGPRPSDYPHALSACYYFLPAVFLLALGRMPVSMPNSGFLVKVGLQIRASPRVFSVPCSLCLSAL